MQFNSLLRFESLEIRSMLAADLGVGEIEICGADAGYLTEGQARPVQGDANCDGFFDSSDIVLIMQANEFEDNEPVFDPPGDQDGELIGVKNVGNSTWEEGDFDGDGDATTRDIVLAMQLNIYEGERGGTRPAWDVNRDGVFDSGDLVLVFQAGEYEDDNPLNSTAAEGDWNGDQEFTSSDLVLAMQSGQYVP